MGNRSTLTEDRRALEREGCYLILFYTIWFLVDSESGYAGFFPCFPFVFVKSPLTNSCMRMQLFCFILKDNSTTPMTGGNLSSKQITLITVSALVGCMTALFAIYVIR